MNFNAQHDASAHSQRSEPPPRRHTRQWRDRRQSLGGLFNLPKTPLVERGANDWGERRDIEAAAFAAKLQDRRNKIARERAIFTNTADNGDDEEVANMSEESGRDAAEENDIVAESDADPATTRTDVAGEDNEDGPGRADAKKEPSPSTEAEDYLYPGERYVATWANRRRPRTTIVYAAADGNTLEEPELLLADPDSLDACQLLK